MSKNAKKVLVCGGDGFCGWPTTLELISKGHSVMILDNLSRRKIDVDLSSSSLTKIAPITERIEVARSHLGDVTFEKIDIANEYDKLCKVIREFQPDTIVQFAEQRSAPYSMLADDERRYTVDNNIRATHNICSAIVEYDRTIHLVHLGTMGVYGYNKDFGAIPEGYLDITVNQTKKETEILYPANPGSIYHLTKCLDQLLFQFYVKNWGLKITDLHQGIVWGTETQQTKLDSRLINRFDYDGIYGTVLNRFIVQAALNKKLSVYGTGGQSRAFIHISDTARCVTLAIENDEFSTDKVRIFNQVSEVHNVLSLAKIFEKQLGSEIEFLKNPRKELANNDLEVSNTGLRALGFEPIKLSMDLINDVKLIASNLGDRVNDKNINNSPKW